MVEQFTRNDQVIGSSPIIGLLRAFKAQSLGEGETHLVSVHLINEVRIIMSQTSAFILSNVKTSDGQHVDVWVADGVIHTMDAHDPRIKESDIAEWRLIDGCGGLISPPFVDAHFHLDATLSLGRPRLNRSGTLLEGINIWAEQKPSLTEEDITDRARS